MLSDTSEAQDMCTVEKHDTSDSDSTNLIETDNIPKPNRPHNNDTLRDKLSSSGEVQIQDGTSSFAEELDTKCTTARKDTPSTVLPALDGGYGWVVLLATVGVQFLIGGWSRAYGVLYVELLERFGSSAAVTAWVGGAHAAMRMLASPVATSITTRYSARVAIFTGGIFLGCGTILSSFAPSTEFLFFSHSLVCGFGGALAYAPSLVLVREYFDKMQAMSQGFATAGSGTGLFLFPFIMEALLIYYGYTGAMLIMGALLFHVCVSGMLSRPLMNSLGWKVRRQYLHALQSESKRIGVVNEEEKYSAINQCDKETCQLTKSIKSGDDDQYTVCVENEWDKWNQDAKKEKKVVKNWIRKFFNFELLLDPVMIRLALSLCLITMAYIPSQMLIMDLAIHRGVPEAQAGLLISIAGAMDLVSCIACGFLYDIPIVKRHRIKLFNVLMVIFGGTCYMLIVSYNFIQLVIWTVIHGLFCGSITGHRVIFAADLLGMEKLASSFGITMFVQGLGLLIGPAFAGYLRDVSGDYTLSYVFTGSCSMLAAVIFLFNHNLCNKHAADGNPSKS